MLHAITRPRERIGRAAIDFDTFFRAHHQRLIACGLALTGDRERAREGAQEALSRAFRDWDRVQHMDEPGAWVRRVLVNVLIDEGRRAGRERRLAGKAVDVRPVPDHDPAWTPLMRAIRALPERQRLAVVLHYLDDLPVAQVAAAMDVAEGTVKTTLFHARASLAAALEGEER